MSATHGGLDQSRRLPITQQLSPEEMSETHAAGCYFQPQYQNHLPNNYTHLSYIPFTIYIHITMQYDERLRIKSQIDGLRSHMKSIKSRTNHQPTVLKSLLIAASLHAPEVAGNPQATKSVEVRRSDEMGLENNVSSVDLVTFSFHLVFCAAS